MYKHLYNNFIVWKPPLGKFRGLLLSIIFKTRIQCHTAINKKCYAVHIISISIYVKVKKHALLWILLSVHGLIPGQQNFNFIEPLYPNVFLRQICFVHIQWEAEKRWIKIKTPAEQPFPLILYQAAQAIAESPVLFSFSSAD